MKYRYKKTFAVIYFILIALLSLSVFFIFYPMNRQDVSFHTRIRALLGTMIVFLFFVVKYLPEYLNRYVELNETYIHCHSFRFKGKMKVMPLNMMYKNIYKISYKKKFGLFNYMYIYENSLDRPVTITFAFQKHKQLFAALCANVLAANPKAFIDKR